MCCFNYLKYLIFFTILTAKGDTVAIQCRSNLVSFGPDIKHSIFKSPGFPVHYCNNLRSVFEIEPHKGYAVSLSIEFFDTEANHDYVEIHQTFWHDGVYHSIKQQVLSGTMGHQPRHFTSSKDGGLKIVFITDATENEFSGFQMRFQRFKPDNYYHSEYAYCLYPFYQSQALSTLPTVKKNFRHDTSCVIQINSTDAVKLTIKSIAKATSIKFLETENFKSNRPLDILESLNGFTTHRLPYILQSRTNSLTLLISFSEELDGNNAYEIDYEFAVSVCSCKDQKYEVNSTNPQILLSPGYPLEYCDGLKCPTHITALIDTSTPPPSEEHQYNTVVQILFNNFFVETDVDFLQLIDGGNQLLNLSDNAKGLKAFTFDHKQADLKFISDHSVVEKGYNITAISYKKPYYCQCPDSPKKLELTFHEENHTFSHECRYMDCFWRIYPPSTDNIYRLVMKINYRLRSVTEFIEISNGENLERNHEKIRLESDAIPDDGDTTERFVEYDGNKNNYIQVWYHREGDLNDFDRIFNYEYSWKKRCQCGKTILLAKSNDWLQLTSPDYPTPYCNNLTCTWFIKAPKYHIVTINITDFLTEIDQDFLGIFNGNDTNGTHIELLSGMEQLENLVKSEDDTMSIVFKSDVSLSLRGFSLWYKAEPTPEYIEKTSTGLPGWILLFLLIIAFAGGALFYMIRTDKLDTSHIDIRSIRFINPDRFTRRTDSESSLMNPVYRSTADFH